MHKKYEVGTKYRIKGVCGQTQLFRELCLSSAKKYLHHIFSKQSLQMQQRSRNVSG